MRSMDTVYQWMVHFLGVIAGLLVGIVLGFVLGFVFAVGTGTATSLGGIIPLMIGMLGGAVLGGWSWLIIGPWLTQWNRPVATIGLLLIVILSVLILIQQRTALIRM